MTKKLLVLFSLFILGYSVKAQEKIESQKLGVFTSLEAQLGFDLASIFRQKPADQTYDQYFKESKPGKFNYGFTGQIGIHPISWFAISGGLRYSYIDPNFHMLYFQVQPYFFVTPPDEKQFGYVFGTFGTKINQTAANHASFGGVGVGRIEPLGKRFGQKYQIYLEDQVLDGNGTLFIGISYGIVLFSN